MMRWYLAQDDTLKVERQSYSANTAVVATAFVLGCLITGDAALFGL